MSEKFNPETVPWETAHRPGFVRLSIEGVHHVMDCAEAFALARAIQDSAQKAENELLNEGL